MKAEIPGLYELLDYFKREGIHTCILYGSAAAGRLRAGSDIDLAIAAETELSPETLTRHYLQATSLLKREVDLRDLRRAKGLYLTEVLTKGKILLNDNPQFLGNKSIEMMDYQTDLAPQITAIRRRQLERSLYE